MTARIIDKPSADLSATEYADVFDADTMAQFNDVITKETATNTGSLMLWGSSAYPRMDRADTAEYSRVPNVNRMLVTGAGFSTEMPSGRRIAYRQLNGADGSVTLRDSVAF